MPAFANSQELMQVMETLWERIKADPDISKQLIQSKLIVQFRFHDPDGVITIDCEDGQQMIITVGTGNKKAILEMTMKSDVAHEFWLGRVSLPAAILAGKIVSKGPTPRALALLPVIRQAFPIYPHVLKDAGKQTLVLP